MNSIVSIVYLIIFILMLVFVFSTGLLIPIIGKKNIIVVCIVGFIVGIVGGGFFISPIYQDLPYLVGDVHSMIDSNHEFLNVSVNSSNINSSNKINDSINTIKNMKGFKSLESSEFKLMTSKFSQERKKLIEKYLSNKNYSYYGVNSSGVINIQTKKEVDSNEINIIAKWLDYTGGVKTKEYIIYFNANINAFDINDDINMLNEKQINIESITGKNQDSINLVKSLLVSKEQMILICGLLGFLVALISVFFDSISRFFRKFKKK